MDLTVASSYGVKSVFRGHFPLQKSPCWHHWAGMWVRASLWRNTEAGGCFLLTKTPNMLRRGQGGSRVKSFVGGRIPGYQDNLGEFFTCKQNNGYNNSQVGLSGPKNLWYGNRKRSTLTVRLNYQEFLSSTNEPSWDKREWLSGNSWSMSSDNGERKKFNQIPRYDIENCCKCRLSILPKKSTTKRCNFRDDYRPMKTGL